MAVHLHRFSVMHHTRHMRATAAAAAAAAPHQCAHDRRQEFDGRSMNDL